MNTALSLDYCMPSLFAYPSQALSFSYFNLTSETSVLRWNKWLQVLLVKKKIERWTIPCIFFNFPLQNREKYLEAINKKAPPIAVPHLTVEVCVLTGTYLPHQYLHLFHSTIICLKWPNPPLLWLEHQRYATVTSFSTRVLWCFSSLQQSRVIRLSTSTESCPVF